MIIAPGKLLPGLFAGTTSLVLSLTPNTANAQSSVDFKGELDVYASEYQPAGGDDVESTSGIQSNGMTTSYLGAHGKHELGNGLTGIAAVEMFFQPDSAEQGRFDDDVFFARAAYVGLAGGFGEVQMGRTTSLHFLSAILFNPFGDSFAFSPMMQMSYGGGGLYGDTGWSDSVMYSTPELGGFKTSFAYAFGEEEGETSTNKMAANTFFKSGNFGLTAAVQDVSGSQPGANGLAPDGSQLASLLGLSYDIGKSTIFAQYQLMRDDLPSGDIDRDTLILSANIAAGPGAVYLGYGYTETSTTTEDYDRSIYTLVYNLPMTSQFDTYAAYTSDDPDLAEQSGHTVGVGARFRF
ncbi:MAG: putative porin transrane protein [Cellvibrio sp.]|jgi:predicted porin|nr:putative porin transrane protein [Cellvibrio sp.]